MIKKCNKCNIEKDIDLFIKYNKSKDGFGGSCKECINKIRRERDRPELQKNKSMLEKLLNENMSICIRCNVEKDLDLFIKDNRKKSGIIKVCKDCNLLERKLHYEEYNINRKKYNENNREKLNNISKEYYQNNKESKKIYNKIYRESNRENRNIKNNKRLNDDPLYKLTTGIRSLILISLKSKGYSKSSKTSHILGCSFEDFKLYLESRFESWMNWNNKGLYNGELNYGWDLDHIIPISSAKSEEEIILLNHYTNLQPLCSKINRDIKKDKVWQ